MNSVPLLSLLILIPLFGALAVMFIRRHASELNAPRVAMLTSLMTLTLSIYLWMNLDPSFSGFQFVEKYMWIPAFGSSFHLGIDGISLSFIILTNFLMVVCFVHPFKVHRVREFYIAFLLLQAMLMGVFASLDLVLFYVFFEAVLIPMFLIIGIWGGDRRVYAAFKFFLYTLAGSVLMLIAFVVMYFESGTTNMVELMYSNFAPYTQKILWLALFVSFAVKVPMWPVHTWLPDAHVEAPTLGSMILAGILLKLGGYGMLRLSIPLLPDASYYFAPLVYLLSLIAIVYTSFVALAQKDMKKLVAYSSIAHMGFVTLGLFTFHPQGMVGGMTQMISHGLTSAALFFCVGIVYERFHTKEIAKYGGLVEKMPRYAVFFMIFTLASIGLPGTSGFLGEFFALLGSFAVSPTIAGIAVLGVIIGAAYALWLYRRVVYEKLNPALDPKGLFDIKGSEVVVMVALAVPVFVIGLYPQPLFNIISPATQNILKTYEGKRKTSDMIFNGLFDIKPLAKKGMK